MGANDRTDKRAKRGPLETAIETKDYLLLLDTIRARCQVREDGQGCWSWTGAKKREGYAYIGRARTNRLAHRVVKWGEQGFPGALEDLPVVHHTCGARDCLNPSHLALVTSLTNVLESQVRTALLNRVETLTKALRAVAPEHPLLIASSILDPTSPAVPPPAAVPPRGVHFESSRNQLRRLENKQKHEAARLQHQIDRFRQVIAVQDLVRRGRSLPEALRQVGMARSAYSDWKFRHQEWMSGRDR